MPGPVKSAAYDHDTGYMVVANGNEYRLLRMEILDDPETSPIKAYDLKFAPRLDSYALKEDLTIETGSYLPDNPDADPNVPVPPVSFTKVYFQEGQYFDGGSAFLMITNEEQETFFVNPEVEEDADGYFITIQDDISQFDVVLGLGYSMSLELPSFFVKEGEGNRANRRNPPMVMNVYLDLFYSGRYRVTIDKKGYTPQQVDVDVLQADTYMANGAAMDEFQTEVLPVFCRGDLVKVSLEAPDPLPAAITSYAWEGQYSTRGIAQR